MATNGYTISAYETNTNIENNTSYVYVTGTVTTDSNTFNYYGTAYYNFSASVGSQSFSTGNVSYTIGTNSTKVFSATFGPFYHNDDGSLGNVSVSSTTLIVPGYSSTQFTRTASVPMSTIPRASSIGDVTGNIGSTVTIPIDRKSSSFTTTLTYAFGSLSGTIVDKTTSTSPTWTIPNTFYAQIPNSKRGIGTITCKTYNGNTQIGSDVIRTLTANAVEANVNPTVSISSVTETDTKLISKLGSGGAYIKSYSKPKVTFNTSARSSASLTSVTVNGVGVPTNTTQYTINNINTNTITIIATDSRGYQKSATQTLTPFDNYSAPNATFTALKRNTPTNGQIDIDYSGTWYNGNFDGSSGTISNTLTISLQYKESGTNTWINYGTIIPTISSNNFSQSLTIGDDGSVSGLFDYTKAWDIKLTIKDYLCDGDTGYDSIIVSGSITKGKPTFWWDNDLHVEGDLYVKGNNFSNILNMLHPVGEIYLTTSSPSVFNPNTAFGGTWTQLTGNEYLRIMSGSMAQTGGSNTLTIANLPAHYHTGTTNGAGGHSHTIPKTYNATLSGSGGSFTGGSNDPYEAYTSYIDNHTHTFTTSSVGSGTEFTPKYYGCYAWLRQS